MTTLYLTIKRNVLITLLLILPFAGKAQDYYGASNMFNVFQYSPSVGLSTPQASDFMKYGNLDINHYNGLLNMEIPLDGYKDKDFDLPMSLKYVSSGFMPGKRSSVVGYNWLLNFGGVITRNVKGSPDDTKGNPTQNHYQYMKDGLWVVLENDSFWGCPGYYLESFRIPIKTGVGYDKGTDVDHDYEPDIFQFSFGNHSGSFIIGNNGNPVTTVSEGYKIDLSGLTVQEYSTTAIPQESTIKITAPDGYIYEFGGNNTYLEYFIPNNPEGVQQKPRYITAWYLKSIKAPNARKIDFEYESRRQPVHYRYFMATYYNNDSQNTTKRDVTIIESTYTPVLKQVRIDNSARIDFATRNNGPAFFESADNTVYLTSISYYYNSEKIKETTFNYLTKGKHLYLNSLQKNAETYSFKYNLSFTPPSPLTLSLDHWGFWNGSDIISFTYWGVSRNTVLIILKQPKKQIRFFLMQGY